MLSLWNNPLIPEKVKSDSRMSTKSYFDRVFEEAFNDLFHVPSNWNIGIESKKNEDGSLSISIDVPGIKEPDLAIEVSDSIITVKGERKTATSSHTVQKSFSIPEGYDTDNITAELKDGILSLKIIGKPLPSKEVKKIPLLSSNK